MKFIRFFLCIILIVFSLTSLCFAHAQSDVNVIYNYELPEDLVDYLSAVIADGKQYVVISNNDISYPVLYDLSNGVSSGFANSHGKPDYIILTYNTIPVVTSVNYSNSDRLAFSIDDKVIMYPDLYEYQHNTNYVEPSFLLFRDKVNIYGCSFDLFDSEHNLVCNKYLCSLPVNQVWNACEDFFKLHLSDVFNVVVPIGISILSFFAVLIILKFNWYR